MREKMLLVRKQKKSERLSALRAPRASANFLSVTHCGKPHFLSIHSIWNEFFFSFLRYFKVKICIVQKLQMDKNWISATVCCHAIFCSSARLQNTLFSATFAFFHFLFKIAVTIFMCGELCTSRTKKYQPGALVYLCLIFCYSKEADHVHIDALVICRSMHRVIWLLLLAFLRYAFLLQLMFGK